jgi:hypothetical protein
VLRMVALAALLLAPTPFDSSVEPLPRPVQQQLKERGFWHRGCPVPLSGLRLLTVSYRDFAGQAQTGQLIVNKSAARPLVGVFRRLYQLHFPIRHMSFADMYGPPQQSPARWRRQRFVPLPASGPVALHRRRRDGLVVDARLRARDRPQPAREPLRWLRPESRPRGAAVPRPLATPARNGDPACRRGVSLDRVGLGRLVDRQHEGLHALLVDRALASVTETGGDERPFSAHRLAREDPRIPSGRHRAARVRWRARSPTSGRGPAAVTSDRPG